MDDAMTPYGHDAMTPSDLEPDDATVMQEEPPTSLGCIPVSVEYPVRTVALPAKGNGSRRWTVSTTTPQKVLGKDPRRKRAVLQVYDATGTTHGVLHGVTRQEVAPGNGADGGAMAPSAARLAVTLPAGGIPVASPLLELTSQDELWVIADTAACELSVVAEQWAD